MAGKKVYYLGGLVFRGRSFPIRAGDKLVRFENKVGSWIELEHDAQIEDLINTHFMQTKNGNFPAFTTDYRVVQMALKGKREKTEQAKEEQTREQVIASMSREEVLAILQAKTVQEDEEEQEEEVV